MDTIIPNYKPFGYRKFQVQQEYFNKSLGDLKALLLETDYKCNLTASENPPILLDDDGWVSTEDKVFLEDLDTAAKHLQRNLERLRRHINSIKQVYEIKDGTREHFQETGEL